MKRMTAIEVVEELEQMLSSAKIVKYCSAVGGITAATYGGLCAGLDEAIKLIRDNLVPQ